MGSKICFHFPKYAFKPYIVTIYEITYLQTENSPISGPTKAS